MIFHLIVDISQYLDAIFSIISYRKIILSCILDLDIGFDTALTPAGKMERIIRGDEPEVKVCCPGGVRAVYRNHLVRLQGVRGICLHNLPGRDIPLNPAGGPRHAPALAFRPKA